MWHQYMKTRLHAALKRTMKVKLLVYSGKRE